MPRSSPPPTLIIVFVPRSLCHMLWLSASRNVDIWHKKIVSDCHPKYFNYLASWSWSVSRLYVIAYTMCNYFFVFSCNKKPQIGSLCSNRTIHVFMRHKLTANCVFICQHLDLSTPMFLSVRLSNYLSTY